jgi:hypothetical protein
VIGEYGTAASNVIAERIWMTPAVNDGGAFGGDDGTGGLQWAKDIAPTACL